jgi:hypothetical protein
MPIFSAITRNLSTRTPEIIIGSLSLIAGLAWNNAFIAVIDYYFPGSQSASGYLFKFLYAVIITILFIVLISLILLVFPEKI